MSKSHDGLPNGEALIELDNEEDIEAAEKKHNEHIGRRYIEGGSTDDNKWAYIFVIIWIFILVLTHLVIWLFV